MNQNRAPTRIYMTVSELADVYHKSPTTINTYLKEMQSDSRYKGIWVLLDDSRPKMINRNAFEDYLHFRTYLKDRNLRKHLDPFDPVSVARMRGEAGV